MSSRRCFEVADDTIDNVLAIYVKSQSCSSLAGKPVVAVVVLALAILLRDSLGVLSTGDLIYANGIFESVLHESNDFGSAT